MKKLFIVMLSVFALMLVGCSNPTNSGPTSDPYLLGLDDCEVTLAAIEAGVQNDWSYDVTSIIEGTAPLVLYDVQGNIIASYIGSFVNEPDFKCYANADFSTIVAKYKSYGINGYIQCIKK